MSDPENFLTRWSRRKRTAGDEPARAESDGEREHGVPETPCTERAADTAPVPTPAVDTVPVKPAFDLSSLPPIESITAQTDIRAFLAPGVPAEMRLAALRRAWVADPKVRDFVGLNDYDFDFHTPGAIPGFGPLEMTDELRREVLQIVGALRPEPAPATQPTAVATAPEPAAPMAPAQLPAATEEINAASRLAEPAAIDDAGACLDQPDRGQDEVTSEQAITQRNKGSIATQQKHSPAEDLHTFARRGHGRALPK
ncbi:MAG TPA: DUF3306 domain-containing protein [Xanthobacteraceae bacterium]|nr:DUF3306 domain-containing protein [Xanthobacteraceae bacterium]